MDLRKLVGRNIKKLRKLRHWTQAELAERVGIEPVTLARIETGMHFPKDENLICIAKHLNVGVNDLFLIDDDEAFTRESALNYIHFSIHNLHDRDLKILCSVIKKMSCC